MALIKEGVAIVEMGVEITRPLILRREIYHRSFMIWVIVNL